MELTTTQKRQRLLTMIFGAVAIFFTGYPHVWSIYQPYVMEQAGWSQTAASMCFYLALSTFVFGNIIGGRLQDKYNPKIVVWIGCQNSNSEDTASDPYNNLGIIFIL